MKDDRVFLRHILDAITRIESYIGTTPQIQFLQNTMMQDAVIRQIEIIGEAARNLSERTKKASSDTEWPAIIGMRNRLIHGYFNVDIELVWEITAVDLPLLKKQVETLLKS